ncbi:hypothetical protein PENSPDRAFT_749476 [Peniophora sp. CONT]|nr:hypothetical protein PENSPDRAFT_749476 [Peniophora sp. CONT]
MSVSSSELSDTVPSTPILSFSTLSSSPVPTTRRHSSRFSVQIVVFEADGVIFEVPRYGVPQSATIAAFEARFPCPREDPECPGSSVDNPIVVHCVTEVEFCCILTAMYPPTGQTALFELTSEEWTIVFRLAKMLGLVLLRAAAFDHVDAYVTSQTSIEKIKTGIQLEEIRWIQRGFREIAIRNSTVTVEERQALTPETYLRLLELREYLSEEVLNSGVSRIWVSNFACDKENRLTDDVLHKFLGDEVGVFSLLQ